MLRKSCKNCSRDFEILENELNILKRASPVFAGQKFELTGPIFCSECRQMRRLSYRNEKKFYRRKSDFSGKPIIAIYSDDKKVKVFGQDEWWSDEWDPKEYGRDFDFSRPFFEQFLELAGEVPRPPLINMSSENSVYTNHAAYNKNCYMCINTGYSEDCYYITNYCLYNKNCVDCLAIQNCEVCYFCTDCQNCTFSRFLQECRNCHDSSFCYDCQSCSNCFGCYNLRNKKYHIFNKEYSPEEYQQKIESWGKPTFKMLVDQFHEFQKILANRAFRRFAFSQKAEACSGDHLLNDKNVRNSFYAFNSEDCAYCYDAAKIKDCCDVTEPFKGELQYETHACNINYRSVACSKCYENNNIYYSQYCWYCSDVFGCFGLRRKKYCVLNKQYSSEEYLEMVGKIIEHMQKTGEWGEFFPMKDSPFNYNETTAFEYFPLSKDEALEKGCGWTEFTEQLGESSAHSHDCLRCKKPFLIVEPEKHFIKKIIYRSRIFVLIAGIR